MEIKINSTEQAIFNGSSQKSLVINIFAVGHRKIVDFPALAKKAKQFAFLQKSDAYFSPLKVFAIRSTFWGPRDCRNRAFISQSEGMQKGRIIQ
ncbi:MAG: hypothetical protein IJS60_00310 [Abditibacteriota bacterium]|nr:hypothetical protein [Abditibacteriota bacterium]